MSMPFTQSGFAGALGFHVQAASYWRYKAPCFSQDATLEEAIPALAARISLQARQLLSHVGAKWKPTHAIVCSTIISPMITEGGEHTRIFKQGLAEISPFAALHIVNAYECASWGYVMRHYAALPDAARLLVCIADIDVHQFDHWTKSEIWQNLWGRTGFGVTVLCLERPSGASGLTVSPGSGAGSMMEFAKTVKAYMAASSHATVCTPFFPPKTQLMIDKLLGSPARGPGLHAQYGHCFGSDPWISLISQIGDSPRSCGEAIVASLAFNGYHAVAKVRVDESTYLETRDCGALHSSDGVGAKDAVQVAAV